MMHRITLTAALVATTLSTAATAADWVFVSRGSAFSDYVDRESIRTMPNGYKRAWVLKVFDSPKKDGATSNRALLEFDCREGRYRILALTVFKGKELEMIKASGEWDYVPPESVVEGQLNYVCFGKLD